MHNIITDELLPDSSKYQRLLGKLLYLTVTRPDIAFSVQILSQFMQKPKRSHMEAAQREVRYVKNQPGQDIGIPVALPVTIHADSKTTIQIAANPVFHERTKHIEIDCHFIREKIQNELVKTEYVATKEQLADVQTKGLTRVHHEYLMSKLGVLDIFISPSLRGSVEERGVT
uniref:Copia protein n=1 Tax=Nicotiana tabacum TaxID=4097 RepID=A0A1S3XWW1_TOBAC|nr:PREDICTED: uncharacterized protein LOC107769705 [Nicotiana tabacum]